MNSKLDQLIFLLKKDLRLYLGISFGIFLFVLFFQPFQLDKYDFNNRLLIVAGLCGIVFLFTILVRAAFILILQFYNPNNHEPSFPAYLGGFVILALCSVAFAFYLRYVGSVTITFYTMFKVVLICLFPPLSLGLYDELKELKQQNESLLLEKELIQEQFQKDKDEFSHKSIEFVSENSSETLSLQIADIALIKSADNYVEIVFKEGDHLKKKLIRNTLKSIEQQIRSYPNFIRCHRICIVNKHYIEKLNRKFNNHWLTIKDLQEQIPVSRQYLLKLKEAT